MENRKQNIKILYREIYYGLENTIEFFFYAYDRDCAELLAQELISLGYSAQISESQI